MTGSAVFGQAIFGDAIFGSLGSDIENRDFSLTVLTVTGGLNEVTALTVSSSLNNVTVLAV